MAAVAILFTWLGTTHLLRSVEAVDVCYGEESRLHCDRNKVILMRTATYGHMPGGKCIVEEATRYLGCSNDVLPLFDRWCSGKQECSFDTRDKELDNLNVNCPKFLLKYVQLDHDCIEVNSACSTSRRTTITGAAGYLSSYITHTKGCGMARNPWIISAKPGQTIQLELIDFSATTHTSNLVSCRTVYGFILEVALGINQTICGGRSRQMALYSSKTNSLKIHLLQRTKRDDGEYLIKYNIIGCSELSPPANTWYKREGNVAVIGCQNSDKQWKVKCTENAWFGEIGNCTQRVVVRTPTKARTRNLGFSSVVIMAGIIGGAVVVSVIAIVFGVVYVKKYKMRQETKRTVMLHKTYSTMERNIEAYYRPVAVDQSRENRTPWDMPSQPHPDGQTMSSVDQCTCATLQMRNNTDSDKRTEITSLERQSLYSSIKSN